MINQFVVCGKLESFKDNILTLKVPVKGDEFTLVPVLITFNNLTNSIDQYLHEGDVVAVKGSFDTIDDKFTLIASKLTFLSKGEMTNG